MASPSNSGASSSGVVQNSALSFLASAQTSKTPNVIPADEPVTQSGRLMPAGLKSLYEACAQVYPDQPNPLQVTTRLKYWLGGYDPLDYISMYWNPGRPEENIPPHWHYISFGLSDLHGDGRVHAPPGGAGGPSGFGLELTLRLAGEPRAPPLWPAALLQALARYLFTTGNKFCAGDHISWHAALDGSRSRVRHLLVAADPQLGAVHTPHGDVSFLQMVGCTGRELRAAQRGSGFEVLKAIGEDPRCGGSWLVTRAARRSARMAARRGGLPAELAGVSAAVAWRPYQPQSDEECEPAGAEGAPGAGARAEGAQSPPLSPRVQRQIRDTLRRGLSDMDERAGGDSATGHNMSTDSFEMSSIERALPGPPHELHGGWEGRVQYLDGVHLVLDSEAASLLPLAIDGRVLHGRHFTWRGGARAVTVLGAAVAGALASPARPYALRGDWLQILIPPELAQQMSRQVAPLARLALTDSESDEEPAAAPAPRALCWPAQRLRLTVV